MYFFRGTPRKADRRFVDAAQNILNIDAQRLGISNSDDPDGSPSARYAPMQRTLLKDDELFLQGRVANTTLRRFRKERRRCYLEYLQELVAEARQTRKRYIRALILDDKGPSQDLGRVVRQVLLSEATFIYLRWLACRHALHLSINCADITSCVEFLLCERVYFVEVK